MTVHETIGNSQHIEVSNAGCADDGTTPSIAWRSTGDATLILKTCSTGSNS